MNKKNKKQKQIKGEKEEYLFNKRINNSPTQIIRDGLEVIIIKMSEVNEEGWSGDNHCIIVLIIQSNFSSIHIFHQNKTINRSKRNGKN